METMTVEQALEITTRILSEIQVPVALIQQIGVPISHEVGNIQECIAALRRNAEAQAKEQAETQKKPEAENEA